MTPAGCAEPLVASRLPSSAERARSGAGSGMEALPLGIDEHRRADLDLRVATADRIIGPHPLADPLGPAAEQAEADPVAERGRERHRGQVALVVRGGGGRPA